MVIKTFNLKLIKLENSAVSSGDDAIKIYSEWKNIFSGLFVTHFEKEFFSKKQVSNTFWFWNCLEIKGSVAVTLCCCVSTLTRVFFGVFNKILGNSWNFPSCLVLKHLLATSGVSKVVLKSFFQWNNSRKTLKVLYPSRFLLTSQSFHTVSSIQSVRVQIVSTILWDRRQRTMTADISNYQQTGDGCTTIMKILSRRKLRWKDRQKPFISVILESPSWVRCQNILVAAHYMRRWRNEAKQCRLNMEN